MRVACLLLPGCLPLDAHALRPQAFPSLRSRSLAMTASSSDGRGDDDLFSQAALSARISEFRKQEAVRDQISQLVLSTRIDDIYKKEALRDRIAGLEDVHLLLCMSRWSNPGPVSARAV